MKKSAMGVVLLLILQFVASGQSLEGLQLKGSEIPVGYTVSKAVTCINNQTCTFYEKTELYTMILGPLVRKDIQTFKSKDDSGSVMYFEFKGPFKGSDFLNTLLWGASKKPSVQHPEQYIVKNNLLVIWSFKAESRIQAISQQKVKMMLK